MPFPLFKRARKTSRRQPAPGGHSPDPGLPASRPVPQPAPLRRVAVKRYAAGKVYAYASGPAEFAKHAEAALRAALSAQVLFMRERFVEEMRRRGVPDETVAAYLENVKLDDESYALDEPRD